MPTISFNLTAKQAARIQEATDIYNAATDESITPKRWVLMSIKGAVRVIILGETDFIAEAEADREVAELAERNAIDADLEDA
ncbi:hypothetical protein LCGC14_1260900 [marine sediment metagenome]|uniref:Uncharacterized protein n=1 Tax=marine sediment metagenome TaxID=412755 RepID=A0A0F9P411_9ZZZZ